MKREAPGQKKPLKKPPGSLYSRNGLTYKYIIYVYIYLYHLITYAVYRKTCEPKKLVESKCSFLIKAPTPPNQIRVSQTTYYDFLYIDSC